MACLLRVSSLVKFVLAWPDQRTVFARYLHESLDPNTYLMTFNLPEEVRAYATVGRFYNLARIWQAADAIAAYLPVPSCQVVHFMNRIPLATTKPWVISFESGLPRRITAPGLLES